MYVQTAQIFTRIFEDTAMTNSLESVGKGSVGNHHLKQYLKLNPTEEPFVNGLLSVTIRSKQLFQKVDSMLEIIEKRQVRSSL